MRWGGKNKAWIPLAVCRQCSAVGHDAVWLVAKYSNCTPLWLRQWVLPLHETQQLRSSFDLIWKGYYWTYKARDGLLWCSPSPGHALPQQTLMKPLVWCGVLTDLHLEMGRREGYNSSTGVWKDWLIQSNTSCSAKHFINHLFSSLHFQQTTVLLA